MVIGGCCSQNHSLSLQHALCVLQLCQKMLCMNNLGSCGLFPVSGLNFKTPQDVWQNTLSKCWKRAYTAAPRVNRLVHTRKFKGQREGAVFGLQMTPKESQMSSWPGATAYTVFSCTVQNETSQSLLG